MKMNAFAGLCFAGFVLLGLVVARSEDPARPARRRAWVSAFLAYVLCASFGAGLTQRNAWPFSTWPIVALMPGPENSFPRLVAVDARGREHDVDYRAWQPLGFDELMPWLDDRFPELDPGSRDRVAADLLGRAEESRRRARAGGRPGYFDRFLGPLTAPYFLVHPRLWSEPGRVPAEPFVGLRLYTESWNLEDRRSDPHKVSRSLVYEYRRP